MIIQFHMETADITEFRKVMLALPLVLAVLA